MLTKYRGFNDVEGNHAAWCELSLTKIAIQKCYFVMSTR